MLLVLILLLLLLLPLLAMVARVLLAWEIGSGQGHLRLLTVLAQQLERVGLELFFALSNQDTRGIPFSWTSLQAPTPTIRPLNSLGSIESYFFTDILYIHGFSSDKLLLDYMASWSQIIDRVSPDLIIADYAPALVLAASGKIPAIVVGNGFTVPPPGADFPSIRPILATPRESSARKLLVQENVRSATGSNLPLGELLQGDRTLIFTIPELDPYHNVRNTNHEYCASYEAPVRNNLFDEAGSAWGYLNPHAHLYPLIMDTVKPQCEYGDFNQVLQGRSLAVHHGNANTALTCLLAGIPQLIFPVDQEKRLIAQALIDLGVALVPRSPYTKSSIAAALEQTTNLRPHAQIQSKLLSKWNKNFVKSVTESCIELTSRVL